MVYVTHDQAEAMALGQRLAVLDRGRLQQVGSPAEVYRRPANQFVAGFLGTPPMNFRTGQVVDEAGRLVFESPGLRVPMPHGWRQRMRGGVPASSQVVLGVRPEHLVWETDTAPSNPGCTAVVTLVEQLGPTAYIHGKVAAETPDSNNAEGELVCRAAAGGRLPRCGERVRLVVEAARTHLFDAATGCSLLSEESDPEGALGLRGGEGN
jgi:multiple sugar transport system ATP-binding protein